MKNKYTDFFETAEKKLGTKRTERAKRKAQLEVLGIRLAKLRELQGLNQEDLEGFTQSAISKLEKRSDIKISTLLEYLEAIGMEIQILVQAKTKNGKNKPPIPLLKH